MKYTTILLSILLYNQSFAQNTKAKDSSLEGFHRNTIPERYGEPGYEEEGNYRHGQKVGTWVQYSTMGDTLAVENYRFGEKNGVCYYYSLAGLLRQESWLAVDPTKQYDTVKVYDLYEPDKYTFSVVKNQGHAIKHGTWIFYTNDGYVDKTEKYVLGELVNDVPLANKRKIITAKTTSKSDTSQVPKPQAVLDWEKQNSGKKKIRVRTGATGL